MTTTFLASDHHFSHANILNFKRVDGSPLRAFSSIEEHDEKLIENHNKVVKPTDKIYFLGDVGFRNFTNLAAILARLNGTKVLIKGNHDGFKLAQYMQFFKDVRGSHTLDKFVLTHIPIHFYSLDRWKGNIHGHLHANVIENDSRYINVCMEHINYTPISLDEIKEKYK